MQAEHALIVMNVSQYHRFLVRMQVPEQTAQKRSMTDATTGTSPARHGVI